MLVRVLAIWKRPPMERSIWIGEGVLHTSLDATRAAFPEDGDGVHVGVHGFAHPADSA
jgi:hypothetical protein